MPSKGSTAPRLSRSVAKAMVVAALCFTGLPSAKSAESVIPVTPPGSTDLDQAILPPPGLYGGLVTLPFNRNQSLFDASGNRVPAAFNLKVNPIITAAAVAYVYPFQILGGSVISVAVLPVESLRYSFGANVKDSSHAIGDLYTDLFFWSRNFGLAGAVPGSARVPYGLWIGGGLALIAPTGDYHVDHFLNIGANSWIPDPNVAMTYNTGPNLSFGDSTQISTRLFLGLPFRNPVSGYASGNVLNLDWSVSQLFGRFRIGVAGYYQTQVSDDVTGAGIVPPNGNRFSEAAIGPVAEYVFDNGVVVKAKYQRSFYARNFLDEQFFAFSVITKLY